MYACRVCLSVAVVAMTSNISLDNSNDQGSYFDWNSSQKSIILSSFFYGYVPGQILAGILLKYVSPHIVFGIGTAVPGLLTLLTPVVASYLPFWVLVVTRCVMGIFQAVAIPCLMKFWTIWGPPLEIARLHGIAIAGGFIGTVVALPLSGILADNVGWEYIFYVIGSICLIWYITWLILIRSSPENDNFISNNEKNYIVDTIDKPKEIVSRSIPWLSIFSSLPIYGILVAAFGWGWGYVTMITQLPMFLSDVTEFDLSKNGFLSALPYLMISIMTLLAGYTGDYILVKQLLTKTQVRKYFISFTLLLQSAFILIAAYVANPIPNIICISLSIGLGAFTFSGISVNYIDLAPALAAIVAGLGKYLNQTVIFFLNTVHVLGNTMSTIPGILSPLITGVIVQVSQYER